MRGVDLSLFAFDYDLTWAAVMLEPDGTILGRYGAGHKDSMHYNSIAGLKATLTRALALHQNLDTHRAKLADKRSKNVQFKKPRDLPHDDIKRIVKSDTHRKNCVHCHNIHEGMNRDLQARKAYTPKMIQSRFPTPESCGFSLDKDHGLRVSKVSKGEAAARAGLKVGDVIDVVQGQKVISIADVIWALKSVKDPGTGSVMVKRGGKEIALKLSLKKDWKVGDISWRTSTFDLRPRLGLWVERAPESDRKKYKVKNGAMLLVVKGVFGKEVKDAGLKRGDFIIGVGDWRDDAGERDFAAHTRINYYEKGAKMPLHLLRNGKEKTHVVKL